MMDFPTSASVFSLLFYVPIFAAFSCVAVYYLVYSRRVAQWRKANIPFLQPSFLIGHKYFLNLTENSCLVSIDRIYRENSDKDVVGFFLATIPMVLVRSPALIKQVFVKHFDKTFQPGLAASKNDKIAQNLLNLCTDKALWQSNRNTLSPMFATSRMSGEAFRKISEQIARMWSHAENARLSGRPIDAKQVSQIFINDGISYSLLGVDANSYERPGAVFRMHKDMTAPSVSRMLSVYVQMQLPWAQMFESFRLLKRKATNSIASLISLQMKYKSQHGSNENDFVDFLMRLRDSEENGKHGSDVGITDQMIAFGLATTLGGLMIGDTVSLANFALHLLSLHPEHQDRIRKEVQRVMEKHKTSEFTFDVVRDLRFTDQCLYETARLFPPALAVSRTCAEDFTVPGTNYTLRKGERIVMEPYSVHRDPKYYENPDQFDPERFSPESKEALSPEFFLSFGTGPRKCPGFRIGLLIVATLIGSLLHKYEIKPHSHFKQMDATDFSSKMVITTPRDDILIDIVPCDTTVQ